MDGPTVQVEQLHGNHQHWPMKGYKNEILYIHFKWLLRLKTLSVVERRDWKVAAGTVCVASVILTRCGLQLIVHILTFTDIATSSNKIHMESPPPPPQL